LEPPDGTARKKRGECQVGVIGVLVEGITVKQTD
jgi:hypothetical protein